MARDLHASTRARSRLGVTIPGRGRAGPRTCLRFLLPTNCPPPLQGRAVSGAWHRVRLATAGQANWDNSVAADVLLVARSEAHKIDQGPLQRTRCRRPRGRRLPVAAGFRADTTTPGCANGFKGLVDFEPKSSASYTRVASAPAILHCNFLRCIALYRRSAVPDALPEYSHGPSRNSGSPCCCHLHLRIWLRVRSARAEVGGPEVHRAHSQIF